MPGGRVLMIAHHFPPAGGSGSNRALAFARYLPPYRWQPVVVTVGAEWAMHRDDDLLAQIPADVEVIRTRSLEPRPGRDAPAAPRPNGGEAARSAGEGGSRATIALRSNLGHLKRFPDAHLGWLPFALAAARARPYDVAYSSSGPFTSHLVGLILKKMTKRPWVAELRDGWQRWNRSIFPDYPAWRGALERQLEAVALTNADRVVLVTDRMANAFRHQYPDRPPHHFAVVSNGFDPAQFVDTPERDVPTENFEVLHAGALYYGRSLAAFLEAVSTLVRTQPDFASTFRLKLIGSLDPMAQAELRRFQLDGHISVGGQLDHAATLAAMRSAALLLLVANTTPGAEASVPGKLFEYLAAARPIVAVAPPDSSTADVLSQTGGGWLAPAADANAIACVLRQAFAAHRAGTPVRPDPAQTDRFDRQQLSGDLAQILEQVHARRS